METRLMVENPKSELAPNRGLSHPATFHSDQEREFVAMLAHELRNALNDVRLLLFDVEGHAEATETPRLGSGFEPSGVEAALAEPLDRMTDLVRDLMELARVTHATFHLCTRQEDLRGVVRRAAGRAARTAFARAGVRLDVELSDEPVWVIGDPRRLEMAVENLLSNAARHTPRGGRVTVSATAEGRDAVVRVRDTGCGIAPAVLPRMFEPFVHGGDPAALPQVGSHGGGGTGLGLLIVRTLAELHGGRATARSLEPGAGAEFAVRLPRLFTV